jgi:hypothetical protein
MLSGIASDILVVALVASVVMAAVGIVKWIDDGEEDE